jgi:L-amino acid N-acyltransferase YncA
MQVDRLIADAPRIQEWMHERSGLPIARDFYGIARERNGRLVAAFGYDYFQPTSCSLHLCVDSPTALNKALLSKAFEVPFIQWGYKSLFCVIQESNVKSLSMARRLGFVEIGSIPEALWFGVLYRENSKWLRLAQDIPGEARKLRLGL